MEILKLYFEREENSIFFTTGFLLSNGILPVFQFTFTEPWLLPKIDKHYLDDDMVLAGWLCFYVGYMKLNRR